MHNTIIHGHRTTVVQYKLTVQFPTE